MAVGTGSPGHHWVLTDRDLLRSLLNSCNVDEDVQVVAYNMLNIAGYQPTDEEAAALWVAVLRRANTRSDDPGGAA